MTLQNLKAILDGTGLPCVYRSWPVSEAPALPWVAFYESNTANFAADGKVYHKVQNYVVELYTRIKDPVAEALIETAFNNAGIYWEKSEEWLNDEKCNEIIFNI